MNKCPNCYRVSDEKVCPLCNVEMKPAHACVMCQKRWLFLTQPFCAECEDELVTRFNTLNEFSDVETGNAWTLLKCNGGVLSFDKEDKDTRMTLKHLNAKGYPTTYLESLCSRFIDFMSTNFRPDEIDSLWSNDDI